MGQTVNGWSLPTAADWKDTNEGEERTEICDFLAVAATVINTTGSLTLASVTPTDAAGGLIKLGISGTPITCAVANMKFISAYLENTATSGDNRGMYLRLYLGGAGGGGEAARIFTTVNNVAAGTAHGAHISLSFAATGSITGQGVAGRNTLHIPNAAMTAGTYAALQAEVYSDGASSDPSGVTQASFIRVVNDGNATGKGNVEGKFDLMELTGFTSGTGNTYYGHTLKLDIGGTQQYLLLSDDENRLDLSTINVDAANTDGGVIKMGTSSSPVTEDTANMKFLAFYFDNGATSGDNRGMYLRLYLTGAGGGGEAARIFTSVTDVAAGTAHGAHTSLSFGSTGSITGLGVAARCTLHVPDAALTGGTYASVQSEIWADGSSSDISGATQYSFIRVAAGGDATGLTNVDENAELFEFAGVTAGSAKFIDTDITTHTAYGGLRVNIPGVGIKYLALVSD